VKEYGDKLRSTQLRRITPFLTRFLKGTIKKRQEPDKIRWYFVAGNARTGWSTKTLPTVDTLLRNQNMVTATISQCERLGWSRSLAKFTNFFGKRWICRFLIRGNRRKTATNDWWRRRVLPKLQKNFFADKSRKKWLPEWTRLIRHRARICFTPIWENYWNEALTYET
jgi:hypothetical protein